jgi:hypothetical protein
MATKTPTKPPKSPKGKPRRRRDFDALPDFLPEACEVSDDWRLGDQLEMARLIKRHLSGGPEGTIGDLWDRTSAKLNLQKKGGRPRTKGDWGLVYTAGYVLSKQAETAAFWGDQMSEPLWQEAGFDGRRPFSTTALRFGELDETPECIDALEAAADELVQLAQSKQPRIGRDIYIDGTNTHSRARLHHDCPDKVKCKELGRSKQMLDSAEPELVKTARKEDAKEAPEEVKSEVPEVAKKTDDDRFAHYVWVGGHRYGVLDPDVGVRAYHTASKKVKKFWVGGIDQVATDGFTGASIGNLHAPASVAEWDMYPHLMEKVLKTLGGVMPEVVSGDRGLSVEGPYRWNTERGIASVFPFRKPGPNFERHRLRCEDFDEHGVGRCPCCGGPGAQIPGVTFTQAGYPRIRFTCADPNTVDCMIVSWSLNPADFKHGWRTIIPLSRLSPRYHATSATQLHFEKTFRDRRKRYWVDGADETGKIKRFGLNAHRLRSAAARFLEWFRVCLRHGWINDPTIKRNDREPRLRNGEDRRLTTLRSRRWQGLDIPYGPKALALGFALTAEVPKHREKKKHKGG